MKKPIPFQPQPCINLNDIIEYIEYKYKISVNNSEESFYDWLAEEHWGGEVFNICTKFLEIEELLQDEDTPDWVKANLELIKTEFEDYMAYGWLNVYISW